MTNQELRNLRTQTHLLVESAGGMDVCADELGKARSTLESAISNLGYPQEIEPGPRTHLSLAGWLRLLELAQPFAQRAALEPIAHKCGLLVVPMAAPAGGAAAEALPLSMTRIAATVGRAARIVLGALDQAGPGGIAITRDEARDITGALLVLETEAARAALDAEAAAQREANTVQFPSGGRGH